jgi:two-component system, chemotaxis family, chemotaxis protein CheY
MKSVSKTILIVDDSASMRGMVSVTLAEAGFALIEGANGQEGLDRLLGKKVDLIITDLNMPIMDGIQFITKVRAQREHKFTPILMLTTESQDAKKQAAKTAGATGWLTKPFNGQQLLQTIAKVLP